MRTIDKLIVYMEVEELSKYKLAKAIDVHQTTVTNWMEGGKISDENIAKLAEFFGVTTDHLLDDAETPIAPYERMEAIAKNRGMKLFDALESSGFDPLEINKYRIAVNSKGGKFKEMFFVARTKEVTWALKLDLDRKLMDVLSYLLKGEDNKTLDYDVLSQKLGDLRMAFRGTTFKEDLEAYETEVEQGE